MEDLSKHAQKYAKKLYTKWKKDKTADIPEFFKQAYMDGFLYAVDGEEYSYDR